MWYKIFDFNNIFEEKSYAWQLLKSGWEIPFTNVEWLANSGDFVKKGDCIMTCDVDNDYYRQNPRNGDVTIYDKKLYFNAPSDGFLYVKSNRKYGFRCQKNLEICAIYDTKEECVNNSKYNDVNIFTKDYSKYRKVYTPQRVISGDKITDYTILTGKKYWDGVHYESSTKIYLHPSIKKNDKLAIKITSWLCLTEDFWFSSFGGNSINGTSSFIYLNEDYTVDIVADSVHCLVRYDTSLPDFIKFREISGDFSIYFHQTTDDNKITLAGCPEIVHGDFECARCRLTKFENVPYYIGGDFIAKSNKISSFVGMPKYIGGCFNIANNEFDDAAWEYAKENIDGEFCDYNIANNKFVKYRKELY